MAVEEKAVREGDVSLRRGHAEPRELRHGPCQGGEPGGMAEHSAQGDPAARAASGQMASKGGRAAAKDVFATLNYENTLIGCFFCFLL